MARFLWTRFLVFFTISAAFGFFFAALYRPQVDKPLLIVILMSQISVFMTCSGGFVLAYPTLYKFAELPVRARTILVVSLGLLGSHVGMFLSFYCLEVFFDFHLLESKRFPLGWLLPAFMLLVMVNGTTALLENHLIKVKNRGKQQEPEPKAEEQNALIVKNRNRRLILPYHEILYLSAQGVMTIFHTINGEIEVRGLLKEFESRLPENQFMRVHKKYVLNLSYLKRTKYKAGGAYMAYLSHTDNTDEQILPIGRTYAKRIKSMIEYKK